MTTGNSPNEDLISDVKTGLNHVEELLREAAATTGDKATELRDAAMANLKRTRENLADLQESVLQRSKAAARATDDYVHDNPWRALGVAVAAGFLVGLLINRR